jgi:hypothetical protein
VDLWSDLTQPLTFPLRVRRFLAEGGGLEAVPEQLRRALETREQRFLEIIEQHVYARQGSPYRRLLEHAGATFQDVRDLTTRHGLEGTLRKLAEAGVYLRAAELKGKDDVVRGPLSFRVDARDLRMVSRGFHSHSSGTNNPSQRGTSSFDWMGHQTAAVGAFVLAHGLQSHKHAAFEPMLPGEAGMMYMLMLARLGIPCERWFARTIPFWGRLRRTYFSVLSHELSAVGTWAGPGFARPESVGDDGLAVIVRWIADSRSRGERTCVRTAASNSARIATVASAMGISLEGVTFLSSGEPMTQAKYRAIVDVGARTTVSYGFEPGSVWAAKGCANPIHIDEMHPNLNTLAVVENPHALTVAGRTIHPLLYTTLYDCAGRLLLNAESGDYAKLEERNCGCAMQELGLTLHIHSVRSYEKVTAEGMSYPIYELTEILESRLPGEFGGGPCDYQLTEEESEDGQTRLTLRIHPRLGDLDETRVLSRLADELGRTDTRQWFMTETWRQRGTLRALREVPRSSPRGKTPCVQLRVGKEPESA